MGIMYVNVNKYSLIQDMWEILCLFNVNQRLILQDLIFMYKFTYGMLPVRSFSKFTFL